MFFNETGIIGQVITDITVNVTGSLFLTLLGMVLILMLIAVILRIPIEFSAIFIMPLLLVLMAYTSDFFALGGVFLIYIGILMAKNFFFKVN